MVINDLKYNTNKGTLILWLESRNRFLYITDWSFSAEVTYAQPIPQSQQVKSVKTLIYFCSFWTRGDYYEHSSLSFAHHQIFFSFFGLLPWTLKLLYFSNLEVSLESALLMCWSWSHSPFSFHCYLTNGFHFSMPLFWLFISVHNDSLPNVVLLQLEGTDFFMGLTNQSFSWSH